MPHVVYVDSAFRKNRTHSNFEFQLEETLYVEDARMRIDKLNFVDTFLTVSSSNQYLYLYDSSNQQTWFKMPSQAYTGKQLAAAIQVATGITTSYFEPRNEIRMAMGDPLLTVLSEEQLAMQPPTANWPQGASPQRPMSINNILGPYVRENTDLVFTFVNMSQHNNVYLRSSRLTCHNTHGPRGESDVICKIPINKGVGSVIEDKTPDSVWMDLGTHSLRTLDFRLTDANGTVVDLKNQALSFQITID